MVKVKFANDAYIKDVQYVVGDIELITEGDALHLYGSGDAVPYSGNVIKDNFSLPKENIFSNVHGKTI